MMERIRTDSVLFAGAIMLVATFAILLLYFTTSGAMETMFDSFDDADVSIAEDEMNEYLPGVRNALNMGWAIAVVTPALIFVFWLFHRKRKGVYF